RLDQQAWISLARIESGTTLQYTKRDADNGLYLFLIEGRMQAGTCALGSRDGLAISHTVPEFRALATVALLAIEVPLAGYHI
ncbi:MAG: pirin family protein, partial [Pseudomonadota bacterium]|nr:pirin family protein [Pseudomonadota bacterium]